MTIEEALVTGSKVSVPLDPEKEFTSIEISIRPEHVVGGFEMSEGPAIAEIEVVGKVSTTTEEVFVNVLRGDVNCDSAQNLSDPISILTELFVGGDGFCCEVGADTDASGSVNLTDAIYMLNHLFVGGEAPPAPSDACGQAAAGTLGCDRPSCE